MKNEWKRQGASVIAFLLGLALLLGMLSWLYRPRDNTKAGGMDYIMAHGYLGESADGIDVFFVGSSEFYSAISPMRIWEKAGFTSYDMAVGAERIFNTDVHVEQILKTHHPKVVVLDGYVALKHGSPDDGVFAEGARRFPVFDTHENWKRFDLSLLTAPVNYTNREIDKGYRPDGQQTAITFDGFMEPSEEKLGIPLMNRVYLDHIKRLCDGEGVQLVLAAMPSPENWDYPHHNGLQAYADQKGIPFLDLNLMVEELGIDPSTDFRDEGDHLNRYGAEKVSDYLAGYFSEQYGLEDHREDEAYALWNEDYEKYSNS